MSLIGNYSIFNRTPGRNISGATYSQARSNFNSNSSNRNAVVSFGKQVAFPLGYTHPYSWSMPQTQGGLATFTTIGGIISNNNTLAIGTAVSSNITSTIAITNAQFTVVAYLVAAISGSVATFNANMNTLANLQSNITGNISTSNAALDVIAQIYLAASMSGNIAITNALLNTPNVFLQSALNASGLLTQAQMNALVDIASNISSTLTANITPRITINVSADLSANAGVITPESIASSVWSKDISSFTTSGTSGRKLNDSGSASNPWSANIADNNATGTFGWFIQKLLTAGKFLGLK